MAISVTWPTCGYMGQHEPTFGDMEATWGDMGGKRATRGTWGYIRLHTGGIGRHGPRYNGTTCGDMG